MNQHLIKIKSDLADAARQTYAWFMELSRWRKAAVIAVLVIVVGALGNLIFHTTPADNVAEKNQRTVTLESVGALSSNATPLPLTGTVTSRSEASVRAESSGQITVYTKLGDTVAAGKTLATFENATERAQLLQAEGAYEAAKASRDIARIAQGGTTMSLGEAKVAALNTFSSVYSSLDDAVHLKADAVFINAQTSQAKFNITVPNQNLIQTIEQERAQVEQTLKALAARNKTLTVDSALPKELDMLERDTRAVKSLLDNIATALSQAVSNSAASQATIDAIRNNINAGRTTVSAALSSITLARNSLNAATTANTSAGGGGAATGALASADASVKSALGNLQAAQARLEQTIVRSPISGTVNSLPVKTGDFVSAFSPIAVVSNNNALEVVAYVSDTDATAIAVGATARIDDAVDGVVTKIAPALDPTTRKIEVRIGIIGTSALVNGKSVRVEVARAKTAEATTAIIRLPLSAIKITPNGSFVFTVNEQNILVAHPIIEGALMGEQMVVLGGISPELRIVTDARGLKEGMTVGVK